MQVNFWISHDLVYLNTLSSTWHCCVDFCRAQAFRCICTASFTFDICFFLTKKDGNKLILGLAYFLLRNLYHNNYRITTILLMVRSMGRVCCWGDMTFLNCYVTTGSKCHVTFWVGLLSLSSTLPSFRGHGPCDLFDLSRDHMIDVSNDLVGRIPSS